MMLLRHPRDINPDTAAAHSLRRYVVARAAGRTAPEYARADREIVPGAVVWIGCTREEAQPLDGKRFRRIRRPGEPWCIYLGRDITIASGGDLQALFEAIEGDPHVWVALKAEVTRNPLQALRDYRRRGREILASLRRKSESPGTARPPELLQKYAVKGRAVR